VAADPRTLIGRTWGSLSPEERALLQPGAVLRTKMQNHLRRTADGWLWVELNMATRHGPTSTDVVESVPE
jgi:hypothetical protein